jgi:hypothetical protein
MYRLAAPESLPQLLREIIEVGKVAIVADAGILWLMDRQAGELVMVVPSEREPPRILPGAGMAGECAAALTIRNVPDCRIAGEKSACNFPAMNFRVRSVLNVPVIGQESNLLGVMQWLSARRQAKFPSIPLQIPWEEVEPNKAY